MIDRQEILELAAQIGLDANVVEKDYVLGWMLAAISQHQRASESWIFKGGTCLKKCYFETYRFSEDLDFTLLDGAHVSEDFLRVTFNEISEWLYEQTGIELPGAERQIEVYLNPRGNPSAQGRVGYRGPLMRQGAIPRIRFDLTADERLVREGERRPVHHPYSDAPDDGIHVLAYSFEEVFAEKLRALSERERPRDLYDVIHLHRHESGCDANVVRQVLAAKCEFKGIVVPTYAALEASPNHAALRADWEAMLRHQLPELPPFDAFWTELPRLFDWLHAAPLEVASLQPMRSGRYDIDTSWQAPAMATSWRREGIGAPLEMIRFAAANRLTVDLDYEDERGRRATRTIEPYSLRRTKDGELLLYAVRSQDGQDRSYRVDRILGARATRETFHPRYQIELTTNEPLHAPEVSRVSTGVTVRAPKQARSRAKSAFGLKYVFKCSYCGKRFERNRFDSELNPHKGKNGYPCSGRVGLYQGTR